MNLNLKILILKNRQYKKKTNEKIFLSYYSKNDIIRNFRNKKYST